MPPAHRRDLAAPRRLPAGCSPCVFDTPLLVMDSQAKPEEQNTVVSAVGPRPVPTDHGTAGLLSGHDATAVLRQVVQAARALTAADGVAILLYDRESAMFMPSVAAGLDELWLQR